LSRGANITEGRERYDQAIALYEPAVHRPLATRFGQDVGVAIPYKRSRDLWGLAFLMPLARIYSTPSKMPPEIGQAVTLMLALFHASVTHAWCGEYTAANAQADEVANFVRSKRHWYWKA
jgi:hypothetical protein